MSLITPDFGLLFWMAVVFLEIRVPGHSEDGERP